MDLVYGRKTNGIRRALKSKVGGWLASIEDETVRKAAEQHTIVTGGSIASMLLGEQINDFDLYFRNIETAELVAKYYVDKFNELSPKDKYTPEVRRQRLENIRGDLEDRVVIWMQSAGIAAEEQGEYNYFEQMEEGAAADFVESTVQEIAETPDKPKYRPIFLSENAITLSDKVQLVTRFYGEPDDIHKNYDFVHATCSYDFATNTLRTPEAALLSMMSRSLVYTGSLYPIASIFRMKKFLMRGWRITAGEQLKIMWQISELDLTKYEVLREQLTGVDMAYMWQLIDALKNVEREKINSTYVAEIIDRIFG